jgi:ABC-type nitrate/sulfonate/bicarbonate transport system permease component
VTAGLAPIDAGARRPGNPFPDSVARIGRRIFSRKALLRIASLIFVLGIWELWGSGRPLFASYPSAIARAALVNFIPEVWPAFVTTVTALLVGLAVATPIGIAVGFAMGRVRVLDLALTPYVNAIYATPRIALIPILVLWLGLGFELRITIVALGAVFPLIINTYAGAKHVDSELVDTGYSFTANSRQILRTIVMPSSLPFMFAGFRIGIGRGVSGVIVAEMTAALTGLGRILIENAKYFQVADVFVAIMTLGIFSLFLFQGVAIVERWVTPWSSAERLK